MKEETFIMHNMKEGAGNRMKECGQTKKGEGNLMIERGQTMEGAGNRIKECGQMYDIIINYLYNYGQTICQQGVSHPSGTEDTGTSFPFTPANT